VGLRASRSDTQPGFTLEPLSVSGDSTSVSVDATYPIRRSRETNLSATGRVTWRESQTSSFGTVIADDRLRVLGLAANWDLLDQWRGVNLASTELSQGIAAFGASHAGSANLSRAAGRPDFTKLTATASRVQGLLDTVNLRLDLEGQYAL